MMNERQDAKDAKVGGEGGLCKSKPSSPSYLGGLCVLAFIHPRQPKGVISLFLPIVYKTPSASPRFFHQFMERYGID
jgi:hypothetical protein